MAERLYLDGYLTYPRTETNTYPKNFDLQARGQAHKLSCATLCTGGCSRTSWASHLGCILSRSPFKRTRQSAGRQIFALGKIAKRRVRIHSAEGVDMGDHPPITPVRAASESQLGDAYRLYAAWLRI